MWLHMLWSSLIIFSQIALSAPLDATSDLNAQQLPSTQAVRYLVNANDAHERAVEKQAWDGANNIAKAANSWKPGGKRQPIIDYYMGTNCAGQKEAVSEIQSTLKNAQSVHTPGIPIFRARIFVYLHEWTKGSVHYPAAYPRCVYENGPNKGKSTGTIAYSFINKGGYWNDYYVVFCDLFWELQNLKEMRNLNDMNLWLYLQKNLGHDYTENMDVLYNTTSHAYYHELIHLEYLVSTEKYWVNDLAYRPADTHALAVNYGCVVGSSNKDPITSLNNADSYAIYASAAFWADKFHKDATHFAKPGKNPPGLSRDKHMWLGEFSSSATKFNGLPGNPDNPFDDPTLLGARKVPLNDAVVTLDV